jgi:hypothetical protein
MGKTKGSFTKKSSKRHQKFYRMKGCARKTRKTYLGGSSDAPLAYTGQPIPTQKNPFFAYTGKGGALSNPPPAPVNTNAANPVMPNTGPKPTGQIIFNNASIQKGGNCTTCSNNLPILMNGGGCGCGIPVMSGGAKMKHRIGCKCSQCKRKNRKMRGGNKGIPYPDGLVGSPWTPNPSSWPGVNGIPGDSNYYPNNTYNNDVSRQMVDVGANPPFLKGGKRRQKGGNLSNLMGQDLVNLGRQFQFGLGSAYNALAGYAAPVNPLPWKDQLTNKIH